jgi:uncharacterized repeat protein (TIGR01451 family)
MKRLMAVAFLLFFPALAMAQSADQEVVSVVDSPDPVAPGATLTYTVTLRNNGPDPAVNGGININLPLAVTHTTDVAPAGFTCFWLGNNGSCTTPSFAAGSTVVFTINAVVSASLANFPDQSISATFFPSGTTADPNSANNMKSASTLVDSPQVDLALSASDSPDPVFPDGNVTYTVDVRNDGPDAASSVSFNVVPNSALTFVSATVPAGWNCVLPSVGATNATFTCSIASYAAGSTSQFTVVFAANDEQFGINDTTFSTVFGINAGGSNETDNTDNSETETTQYVSPDADLSVTASAVPNPATPGSNITFSGNVANGGPDTASSVTFTVTLDANVFFQSISGPAGFSCLMPAVGSSGVITCTIASLASGVTLPYTLVTQLNPALNNGPDGFVQQQFTIGSGTSDPDPSDNSLQVTTFYDAPQADLQVTKTTASTSVVPGDTITYTITLTNLLGNPGAKRAIAQDVTALDAATNVVLTDVLPAELLFQSITAPAGFSCVTPTVGTNGTVTCSAATLPDGASAVFTLVTTVAASATGSVQNSATGSSSTFDPNSTNNTGTATVVTITPLSADVSIVKTTPTTSAKPGENITYTITVSNAGPNAATSVVVSDTLPAGLSFVSATPSQGTCNAASPASCNLGTINSGASATITLVTTVTATSGTITNSASVSAAEGDPNSANNSASSSGVSVTPLSADLSIVKTTPSTSAKPGENITYTITVSNAGPNAATSVVVSDTLPAGLSFGSATPSQGTCNAASPVSCNLGTINSGASATITLVTVVTATSGTITNSASVSAAEGDPNSANNSASSSGVSVTPLSADLSIVKTTAATSAVTGDDITYTITVSNAGPDAATSVVVSDTLPAGLSFVSATPSQGTCNATSPVSCTLGTINSGASATITLVTTVTATNGTISNTASVASTEADPDSADRTSTTAPLAVVAATAIPTMSETMLLALMLALAMIAAMKMR